MNESGAEGRKLEAAFIVRSLGIGGAERQLITLLPKLAEQGISCTLICLYDGGDLEQQVQASEHFRIATVGKSGRWDVGAPWRLFRMLLKIRPDVVHGYMSGANLFALFSGAMVGASTVWGIRVSDQDFSSYSSFRRIVHHLEVLLSRFPSLIIANSHAGRDFHVSAGYPSQRFIVIHNGVDTAQFMPDRERGARWRAAHGFSAVSDLVVLPARLDPMKDHPTFIAAAQRCVEALPGRDLHFVCAGSGDPGYVAHMKALAEEASVSAHFHWLPAQKDVVALYNAATIVVSASRFGEGFPNVLGEAMACGIPCVATSAGDAAVVIGPTTHVTRTRDVDALAEEMRRVLVLSAEERDALGERAREHILGNFTVDRLVQRTTEALTSLRKS